ncbi:lipase-like protein, partial [Dinothrombium tinctorium]
MEHIDSEEGHNDILVPDYFKNLSVSQSCENNEVYVSSVGCLPKFCGCPFRKMCTNPELVKTKFKFYSQTNRSKPYEVDYELKRISKAPFNNKSLTVFITHGFLGIALWSEWYARLINLYLDKLKEINLILIDWSQSTGFLPPTFAETITVGYQTAQLVKKLSEEREMDPSKVRFIGFSLGGQLAALASRFTFNLTGAKFDEILALDPAGPCYKRSKFHINRNDAKVVKIIHTDRGGSGTSRLTGHVDVCPNGGQKQPGCPRISAIPCSHLRVIPLINFDLNKYGNCQIVAYQCKGYDEFLKGRCASCTNNRCQLMGHEVQSFDSQQSLVIGQSEFRRTCFYTKTSASEPYCEYQFQLVANTDQKIKAECSSIKVEAKSERNHSQVVDLKKHTANTYTGLVNFEMQKVDFTNPGRISTVFIRKQSTSNCAQYIKDINVNFMSNIDK